MHSDRRQVAVSSAARWRVREHWSGALGVSVIVVSLGGSRVCLEDRVCRLSWGEEVIRMRQFPDGTRN